MSERTKSDGYFRLSASAPIKTVLFECLLRRVRRPNREENSGDCFAVLLPTSQHGEDAIVGGWRETQLYFP